MAESQLPPQDDPIVSRSLALPYLIAVIILLGTLFWALWDEAYGQRPWIGFQKEFVTRYDNFLKTVKSQSAKSEEELRASAEFKELEAEYNRQSDQVKPKADEISNRIRDLDIEIGALQVTFVDARAQISADTYALETTSNENARKKKLADLNRFKQDERWEVEHPNYKNKKLSYNNVEELYLGLKDQKARLVSELAGAMKPAKDAQDKMNAYLADNLVTLAPDQIQGLRDRNQKWSPQIRQINVNEANLVDRCESCHMGMREPLTITVAAMAVKKDGKVVEDEYAHAFSSHPEKMLLTIHDPEKFGCSTCHGGNGRATSGVEKAHGYYKHWLLPLWAKSNTEAGCQTCHAADMVLAPPGGVELGKVIDEGKELFRDRGCMGCHHYEGYDKEPEDLLSIRQQMKQAETLRKENLRQAAILSKQGDQAESNEEANRLYQQAEALRVANSNIEGRIEQLDLQLSNVLRDMKKIGPDLKVIRAKLNRNWIPVWLHKPTDFRPTTKMPNFRLTDDQVRSISAYLWQTALTDAIPKRKPGSAARGKELFETRGCMACHSIGEGSNLQGGDFAANLSRLGEKANYDYIVRWVHNPRQRIRPYCPYERKDIGSEDYAKKGLPYVFDFEHSTCPNDGHELQVQEMTVMPSLRLSDTDAEDIATFLLTQKTKEPSAYPEAAFMEDPKLKAQGAKWIRHYGCASCHEISGFEDEGRIGTELTQEGSKPIERLDFALLTEDAKKGGKDPIRREEVGPWYGGRFPSDAKQIGRWYTHKGFFEHKLLKPDVFDYDLEGREKVKSPEEKLRMPDPHLTDQQRNALVTFLLGSQDPSVPANYKYLPGGAQKDIQEGWWIVKKYNCMGCHQFMPGQTTSFMQMARYQDADWKEQLPPKLLTEGARVDPTWLTHFLANPAMSTKDTNRNGVRPYLHARMPTFFFSENELRKLVRFFQALSQQPMPYIPRPDEPLTAAELAMGRSLFSSTAAPCLKCHATGDPAHDRTATAPNFLLVKERLKPGWTERWIIDPQSISPGTSMPSGLFRREGDRWVFSGPTPPALQAYDKDHAKLLVRYMRQLTPEEQRRVASMMGRGAPAPAVPRATGSRPGRHPNRNARRPSSAATAGGSGSR